jgi:trans-aconitate 2-methyltransferase
VGGYAFGDSALAARRLGLLAEVFEPTTRAFLTDADGYLADAGARRPAGAQPAGRGPLELAVDLGCGPGHTTRLLVSVLGPRRTLGLDQSASFVALAAEDPPPGASFAVHDVTVVPFPCRPAGLLFCRFLLGHLADPAAALAAWATQLAPPGGLLLVEEVERIRTDQPALRGYLEVAAALLASRGHTLEIGPRLHRLPDPPGLARRLDRAAPLLPPAPRAAEMFAQNLAVWRDDAVRAGVATDPELDRLADGLATVAAGQAEGTITWKLRQLAFQRI